jgi:hypothetical protein
MQSLLLINSLVDFLHLEVLELSFNGLTGTISTEIAKLNKLSKLVMLPLVYMPN